MCLTFTVNGKDDLWTPKFGVSNMCLEVLRTWVVRTSTRGSI